MNEPTHRNSATSRNHPGGASSEAVIIAEVRAHATHPLRRAVLRSDTPSDAVEWEGDELSTTVHLAAMVGDRIVGVSTWLAEDIPAGLEGASGDALRSTDTDPALAYRLRGMAVADSHRGRHIGEQLLSAGVDEMANRSATVLWAQARTTAAGFYEQGGWSVVGPTFVDQTTDLPHVLIVRRLT